MDLAIYDMVGGKVHRADLGIADRPAIQLGDAEGKARVSKLGMPPFKREIGHEGGEVLGPVEMGEGLGEDRPEQAIDQRRIILCRGACHYSNPAGAGQSGEWRATTLNRLPI